jgi:hypothetical protein
MKGVGEHSMVDSEMVWEGTGIGSSFERSMTGGLTVPETIPSRSWI